MCEKEDRTTTSLRDDPGSIFDLGQRAMGHVFPSGDFLRSRIVSVGLALIHLAWTGVKCTWLSVGVASRRRETGEDLAAVARCEEMCLLNQSQPRLSKKEHQSLRARCQCMLVLKRFSAHNCDENVFAVENLIGANNILRIIKCIIKLY